MVGFLSWLNGQADPFKHLPLRKNLQGTTERLSVVDLEPG